MARDFAPMHFFHRGMADVTWPATKEEVLKVVGDRKVKISWTEEAYMKDLIAPIKVENYESAAVFYNAYYATF